MRRLLLTGAAFAAMGFSSAAAAQDVALDEVVVTGEKVNRGQRGRAYANGPDRRS